MKLLPVCQWELCTLRACVAVSVEQFAVGLFSWFRPSPMYQVSGGYAVVAPPYTPISGVRPPRRPVESSPAAQRFCPICGSVLEGKVCPKHGWLRFYLPSNPLEVNA